MSWKKSRQQSVDSFVPGATWSSTFSQATLSPDGTTLAVYAWTGNVLLYRADGSPPSKLSGFTEPA